MRPWAPQRWAERARKRFKQTPIGVDLRGDDRVGGAGESCRDGRGGGVEENFWVESQCQSVQGNEPFTVQGKTRSAAKREVV